MQTSYKLFISANLILSGLLITLSFNVPEIILRFLLVGELPDGTTLLSPDIMLAVVLLGFVATIAIVSPSVVARPLKLARTSSVKLRLPRHRYTPLQ